MMGGSGTGGMSVPSGIESGYTLTNLTGSRGIASKEVTWVASYEGFDYYGLDYECD